MSFKSLVSAVSEQRHEIKQALKLFPYFETWDENVIAECSRLSSVLEFSPDNVILDSKTGNSHVVYFVLNGVCKMIHHLRARVKTDSYGRTTYKLFSSTGCSSSKTESNTVGFTSLMLTENYNLVEEVATEEVEIEKHETVEERVQSPIASSSIKDEVIGECESEKKEEEEEEAEEAEEGEEGEEEEEDKEELPPDTKIMVDYSDNDISLPKEEEESDVRNIESSEEVVDGGESEKNFEDDKEFEEKVEQTTMEPSQDQPSNEPEEEEEEKDKGVETKKEIIYEPDHHVKVLEECRNKSRQTIRIVEDGQESDIPEDVNSFFVQVGLFYKGASFGLETNVKDRIIISATKVKCLRIPRQFLLQHNPSNIWNRIRLFLDLYLPKEDKILEYFIQDRKWAEDKRKEAEMIAFSNSIFNYTLSAQVPYSIRLFEDIPTTNNTNSNYNNNRRRVKKETRKNKVK